MAQILSYYNIPVMPHSAVGSDLTEDRERFPTLSRVAFTSASMAQGNFNDNVSMCQRINVSIVNLSIVNLSMYQYVNVSMSQCLKVSIVPCSKLLLF